VEAQQHAQLAQQLIAACGGVDEIVREKACRTRSSQLYAFMDGASCQFMPADVIADLEAWCGEPHYSRALFEARPASAQIVNLLTEACEATETAAELQQLARHASTHAHGPTPRERQRIEAVTQRLENDVREIRAANLGSALGRGQGS
jgi:hypothetical protein